MRRTRAWVACGVTLGAAAACARSAATPGPEPAPAVAGTAATTMPAAPARADSAAGGRAELPATPSGLEAFVPAVAAPPDTVGTCGSIAGSAFGEPTLRGLTWTVAPAGGGAERRVLLLVDSAGSPRHYSDMRGSDPRTEIAVNLAQGIGTATNFAQGKATSRVIAPAAAVLAATSLGNGTRVARRVLAQCWTPASR